MTFFGLAFDSSYPAAAVAFLATALAWGLIAGGLGMVLAAAIPGRR